MTNLKQRLKKLREISEKASPPERYIARPCGMDRENMATMDIIGSHNRTPYMAPTNAAFCEASRTALPALLDAVETLVEGLENLTTANAIGPDGWNKRLSLVDVEAIAHMHLSRAEALLTGGKGNG